MARPVVRLVTNVLCFRKDGLTLSDTQIARKLSYFQLVELCRRSPILYSPVLKERDRLTPVQHAQRDAFLRPAMLSLWNLRKEFQPIQGSTAENPFLKRKIAVVEPVDEEKKIKIKQPATESSAEQTESKEQPKSLPQEQDRFVLADPLVDMLVVAPPGTGKTHVLVDRIAHLVSNGFVRKPAAEILVLSFTRSAVAEVRRRLIGKRDQGAHPDVVYARVLTFDSLATRCLMMDCEPEFLANRDFVERITLFNDLLSSELPKALDALRQVRILLIDEVQDLTGERARMVLTIARLVKDCGGAVCFLGDPAQAIYDYDADSDEIMSSTAFLEKIAGGSYGEAPPVRIEFHNYRRFETAHMQEFVTRARRAMGEDGLHPDGGKIEELLLGLGPPSNLGDLSASLGNVGSKAILTRNNLEAYQLWRTCDRNEIAAELWRGASGNYWPGWIARLCLGFRQDSMSLNMAQKRWAEHIATLIPMSFDQAIEYLRRENVISDDRIDLRQLNHVIASGAPIATRTTAGGRLTISTIHRSKGLEFDDVMIYRPSDNFAIKPMEVRVIYVAATRARKSLAVLAAEPGLRRGARNNRRFNLRTNHFHLLAYPRYPSIGLLIDGADEVDWSAGVADRSTTELEDTARFLWQIGGSRIPQDAKVELSKRDGRLQVVIGGRDVCAPGRKLAEDLDTIPSWQRKKFIQFARVQMVDVATHAQDMDNATAKLAFGAACLTLSPVLSGIGEVIAG